MRGIARRLDHDARQVDAGGPSAFGRERAANRVHARQHVGEKMRMWSFIGHGAETDLGLRRACGLEAAA